MWSHNVIYENLTYWHVLMNRLQLLLENLVMTIAWMSSPCVCGCLYEARKRWSMIIPFESCKLFGNKTLGCTSRMTCNLENYILQMDVFVNVSCFMCSVGLYLSQWYSNVGKNCFVACDPNLTNVFYTVIICNCIIADQTPRENNTGTRIKIVATCLLCE